MKSPKFKFFLFICSVWLVGELFADDPGSPTTYTTLSDNGRFAFLMRKPVLGDVASYSPNTRQSQGVCYKVAEDGTRTENWRWTGVYSSEVFISDDGRNLITIGPWNLGVRPSERDLAVAFHRNGKLVHRFSTLDLLENPLSVEVTFSHYQWIDRNHGIQFKAGKLQLRTTEGISYIFDEAGKIVKKTVPDHVKPQPAAVGFRTPEETLTSFHSSLISGDLKKARSYIVDFSEDEKWANEKEECAFIISGVLEKWEQRTRKGLGIKLLEEKISAECAVVLIEESTKSAPMPVYFLKWRNGWKLVPLFSSWMITEIYQPQSTPVFQELENELKEKEKEKF